MGKGKRLSTHALVYISSVVALLAIVKTNFDVSPKPWFFLFPLILVIISGWLYFLIIVARESWRSFDRKMVWFIIIFSFYFFVAPFLIIHLNSSKQNN